MFVRFVRIQCACDTGQVVMIMNCSQHMMQSIVLRRVDPKFTSYRCSSLPTGNFFDRLKKNEAEVIQRCLDYHKMRTKDLVRPLQMDRALFAPMALLGQFPKIEMKTCSLRVSCRSLWSTSDDKPVKDFTTTRQAY